MNNTGPVPERSDFRQTQPLTDAQRISLTASLRDVIQRETPNVNESAAITVAVLATFCADAYPEDPRKMEYLLRKLCEGVIRDFKSGKMRMLRRERL